MKIQKSADLARTIKVRRQALGLTQQDVAEAARITRQSLARIEHGHGGASFDTILRIFEKLGLGIEAVENEPLLHNPSTPFQHTDALPEAASSQDWNGYEQSPQWRTALNEFAAQMQGTAVESNAKHGTKEDQLALLNAAIEAGDPDRKNAISESP